MEEFTPVERRVTWRRQIESHEFASAWRTMNYGGHGIFDEVEADGTDVLSDLFGDSNSLDRDTGLGAMMHFTVNRLLDYADQRDGVGRHES